MDMIASYSALLLTLALIFGLYMTWGIGANDVANAMGTSVGSGALTVKQAIVVAAIFEFAGAYLAGGEVASTIQKGIVDAEVFASIPDILVLGMLASLLAASVWLMVATTRGWPVSTTHSIVGAIVGFAVAAVGMHAVHWEKITEIVASWFVSPVVGGLTGLLLMLSIRGLILNAENPLQRARTWGPAYVFLTGWVIALVTLFKGLKHVSDIQLSAATNHTLAIAVGIVFAIVGKIMINRIKVDPKADRDFHFASVEKTFIPMMIFTGCAMAFAHGSNDVANGIGPLAAVWAIIQSGGQVVGKAGVPAWMLMLGAVGIVIGLATYGYRVMRTIGHRITELTPTRGYSATLAAASVTVFASGLGLPVSSTHIAVGAVMGVGIARGLGALDLRVIGGVVVSWFVTVPAGAILAALFFYLFKAIFI